MTEPELFISTEKALTAVVDQIAAEQWGMPVPDTFQMSKREDGLTLRKVINYHAYDDAWVPDTLSGKTIAEVGTKYDGDLLGEDPKASWHRIVDAAVAAAEALQPNDLDKPVHLTYGDFPAREYLKHIASFRGFRAYDIAKLIGVSTKLPDDMVQGMWDLFAPEVEQWRTMGVFGPEVPVPADAPLQDRLLGLVGRNPK